MWLIGLAYALPAGVYGVWGAVIDVILKPVGIAQVRWKNIDNKLYIYNKERNISYILTSYAQVRETRNQFSFKTLISIYCDKAVPTGRKRLRPSIHCYNIIVFDLQN